MSNTSNDTPVTPDGIEFTITNGQVTAELRVFGTHSHSITIPSNASFTVGSNSITETLTGTKGNDVLLYTQDTSNSAVYHLSTDTHTVTSPSTTDSNGNTSGFSFTLTNGAVTAMQHVFSNSSGSFSHNIGMLPATSFTTGTGSVTETLVYDNVIETIQFVAAGNAGLYAVASDSRSFIPAGSASTSLSVDPFDRAKFTIDASGNVSGEQRVLLNGNTLTINPSSKVTFTQLAPGYVEEVVTHGSHTSYEVYHDGNGDGIYTAVAHGSGSTVDLVGLKTQINSTIESLT